MSIVHPAYQTILVKLREWKKFDQRQRLDILRHASSLMGKHFRQALYQLEKEQGYVKIVDYDFFYSISVGYEKYGLFKSGGKGKVNDCTCRESWMRKIGKNAAFMCTHQIMLELAITVFSDRVKIEKADMKSEGQLQAMLDFVN